jgi:hypothetical protein
MFVSSAIRNFESVITLQTSVNTLKCKGPHTETSGKPEQNLKDVESIPEIVTQENLPVRWLQNN